MSLDMLRDWVPSLEDVERRLLAKHAALSDDRQRDTVQQAIERRNVEELLEVVRHGPIGGRGFVDAFMYAGVEPSTWPDVRYPLAGARRKLAELESA